MGGMPEKETQKWATEKHSAFDQNECPILRMNIARPFNFILELLQIFIGDKFEYQDRHMTVSEFTQAELITHSSMYSHFRFIHTYTLSMIRYY